MVRGGGRGGYYHYSYRQSSSNYRGETGGGRRSFNDGSNGGGYSGSEYRSNYGGNNHSSSYPSRSRERISSSRHGESRHESAKRSYVSERDRSSEKKRHRHEDSRLNQNYSSSSTYRRNELHRTRQLDSPEPPVRSSSYRGARRDDSSSHRHSSTHNMGPPKRLTAAIRPTSRLIRSRVGGSGGGIDSSVANSRSLRGSAIRRGGGRIISRNNDYTMKVMRRQMLVSKQRDRIRKMKLAQMTSSLRKRRRPLSRRSSDPSRKSRERNAENTEVDEDNIDDDKKNNNDDDDDDDVNNVDVDDDNDDGGKKIDKKIRKERIKKAHNDNTNGIVVSASNIKDELDQSKKGEDDNDENIEIEGKITDIADRTELETPEADKNKTNDDNLDVKKSIQKLGIREKDIERHNRELSVSKSSRKKKSFIKLMCVHCRTMCLTFKHYAQHLYSRSHRTVMKRIALRQKTQLARMRQRQRNAQRELDNNSKDFPEDSQPQFCLLCRLNYRQPKAKHQLSEDHRNMKKFLMPYCSTCHIAFKSPMVYEAHRCSLEHIKRKARNNESNSENGSDEREVDLTNFLTVDSIGEIDDITSKNVAEDVEEKINVGAQFVKKTYSFFCSLCQMFYPYTENEASFIQKHCSGRSHLKAYIQHTEDEDLQAKARRVERRKDSDRREKKKETASPIQKNEITTDQSSQEQDVHTTSGANIIPDMNENLCGVKVKTLQDIENDDDSSNDDGSVGTLNEEQILALTKDERLWEDVDKDLGDILAEIAKDDAEEDEEDEEDESVLNIDIESEKQKSVIKMIPDSDDIHTKTVNSFKKKIKSKTEPDTKEEDDQSSE